MNVIVAGAGTLGRRVITYVSQRHEVVAIEKNEARAQAVAEEHPDVRVVVGDVDEPSVLLEAGTDRADVFVATTGDDEDNLVASLLAKNEFGVRKVIAACRNPRNRWLFNRSWGVDVAVDSAQIVGRLIEEEATLSDVVTLLKLREGEFTVTALTVAAESRLVGTDMGKLAVPEGCTAVAVLRGDRVIVPSAAEAGAFQAGDEVLLITRAGVACDLTALAE